MPKHPSRKQPSLHPTFHTMFLSLPSWHSPPRPPSPAWHPQPLPTQPADRDGQGLVADFLNEASVTLSFLYFFCQM